MNDSLIAKLPQPADFDHVSLDKNEIYAWARHTEGANLPEVSALPFSEWLVRSWDEMEDVESGETMTNEDVLRAAQEHWTGA